MRHISLASPSSAVQFSCLVRFISLEVHIFGEVYRNVPIYTLPTYPALPYTSSDCCAIQL